MGALDRDTKKAATDRQSRKRKASAPPVMEGDSLRRSTRSKKMIYHLPSAGGVSRSASLTKKNTSEVSLGDVEGFEDAFSKVTASSEVCKTLYRVLYGTVGSAGHRKRKIREWKGADNQVEAHAKMTAELEGVSEAELQEVAAIFFGASAAVSKEQLVAFLLDPTVEVPPVVPIKKRVRREAPAETVEPKAKAKSRKRSPAAPLKESRTIKPETKRKKTVAAAKRKGRKAKEEEPGSDEEEASVEVEAKEGKLEASPTVEISQREVGIPQEVMHRPPVKEVLEEPIDESPIEPLVTEPQEVAPAVISEPPKAGWVESAPLQPEPQIVEPTGEVAAVLPPEPVESVEDESVEDESVEESEVVETIESTEQMESEVAEVVEVQPMESSEQIAVEVEESEVAESSEVMESDMVESEVVQSSVVESSELMESPEVIESSDPVGAAVPVSVPPRTSVSLVQPEYIESITSEDTSEAPSAPVEDKDVDMTTPEVEESPGHALSDEIDEELAGQFEGVVVAEEVGEIAADLQLEPHVETRESGDEVEPRREQPQMQVTEMSPGEGGEGQAAVEVIEEQPIPPLGLPKARHNSIPPRGLYFSSNRPSWQHGQ